MHIEDEDVCAIALGVVGTRVGAHGIGDAWMRFGHVASSSLI